MGVTDSHYVHDLDVDIHATKPEESGIAYVMPQTCKVSTFKLCPITITGLESGVTSFSVNAIDSDKYRVAKSPLIHVSNSITPGHLSLKITPSSLGYGASATTEATLESAVGVTNLVVKFVSLNFGVASVASECTIVGSTEGTNKCSVELHAGNETGYANIIGYVDNNTYVPVARVVSVHPIPTSGHLEITLESPEITYGQSTHAIISLLDSSYVDKFLVNVNSNNANIATVDEPGYCQLSSSTPSCEVTVTAGNESGIADITTSADNYEPVQTTLTVAPAPIPGYISVALSSPTVAVESDTIAIVKLNNSANVNDAVVTVGSEDTNIANTVGTNVCHLTTANNMCEVIVKGETVGSTHITATSSGYGITPAPIHVITPGYIAMTPSTINLEYGATSTVTLTLNGSVGVNNALVTLTSSDSNIATVSECSPVDISSGSTTCTATITAGQITSNTTITASLNAGGYLYTPITTAVNVTPSPSPGTISITPGINTLPKHTSVDEIVTLNNSRLVNTPIVVNISSQDPNIATSARQVCNLSTGTPSCIVPVRGVGVGSTNLYASSAGYAGAQAAITVTSSLPIAQQCSSATSGTFTTATPFNGVKISYNFLPNYFPLASTVSRYPSSGVLNIANLEGLSPGQQILTNASSTNPVTIGTVTQAIIPGSEASGSQRVEACGGAWASSSARITPYVDLTKRGLIRLHMDNNSNGRCGGEAPQTLDLDLPLNGYNTTVYSEDQQGCGGNNWDIGGNVSVSGSGCDASICSYTVSVNATHGGVGGQCHDSQTKTFKLSFKPPRIYMQLSNLGNFHEQTSIPTFVGYAGQSLNASIGGYGVGVSPVVTCAVGARLCTSANPQNVWYTNNWSSSTTMSYNIGLVGGDTLNGQVCVNFNPS